MTIERIAEALEALVEQQRIANLIALTKETFAAHEAREALGTFATAKLGEQIGLRPDIAAALDALTAYQGAQTDYESAGTALIDALTKELDR